MTKPVELNSKKKKPIPCRKCGFNLAHQRDCVGGIYGIQKHYHCPGCKYITDIPDSERT